MRLDLHVVANHGIHDDAPRFHSATRTQLRLPKQLHARLNHRIFTGGHVRIDQHGFRQLNGRTRVHQRAALPFAEDAVHFGEIGARVAAQNFARITGELGEHGFALAAHDGNGIGQIEFAMLVVRFHLGQSGPKFLQREAINRGIDFVDFALLVGESGLFDNGGNGSFRFANDAPITRWVGDDGRKNGCRRVAIAMRRDQGFQSFRSNERSVAWEHERDFRAAQRTLRDLHGVPRAVLRVLQDSGSPERLDDGGHLLRLMSHDNYGLARLERLTRADDMFDQRAPAGTVQNFGETGLKARALSGGEDDNGEVIVGHKLLPILREPEVFGNQGMAGPQLKANRRGRPEQGRGRSGRPLLPWRGWLRLW